MSLSNPAPAQLGPVDRRKMKRHAAFLDLLGTLGGDGLSDIRTFSVFPFTAESIRLLNEAKLLVFVVTNQSHIAKGLITLDEFDEWVSEMITRLAEEDARVDGVYCCPHSREEGCACKKPKTGLLDHCASEHAVNLRQSYVVGDSGSNDMRLARAAGCGAILVRTGIGEGSLGAYRHLWAGIEPDYVAENLLDATRWMVERETGQQSHGAACALGTVAHA